MFVTKSVIFLSLCAIAFLAGMILFAVAMFEIWHHHLLAVAEKLGYNPACLPRRKNRRIKN